MRATNLNGVRVRINGTLAPLDIVEANGQQIVVAADVSSFAGTTALLRIESPFGADDNSFCVIDDIRFVPEPSAAALLFAGLVSVCVLRGMQKKVTRE